MKYAVLFSCALVLFLLVVSCTQKEKSMPLFGKKTVTIENQLKELAEIGLILNPGIGEEELTAFDDRSTLEEKAYEGLVEVMGMETEEEPYLPLCDQLWMCDYECIEDHGAYVDILQRLERLTSGALALTNLKDYVDLEEELAWVEFEYQGERFRWELNVDDDWLDPAIFVKYCNLLKSSEAQVRIYSNHSDYGQVAFLAAFLPRQKKRFDKLSKIKLTLLEE